MKVLKYYRHLIRKQFLSWRMLAVFILMIVTMDTFLAPLRTYCNAMNVKITQWGFALIWNNKYVGLCFLLIFIFAISIFPEDRKNDAYIISRIGVTNWVTGQSLYLITFAWVYTIILSMIQNILLCNILEFSSEWGKGWATLSNTNVILEYHIFTTVPHLVISNYEPFYANLLVIVIMSLVLTMIGMMTFLLNFYSKIVGAFGSTILILMDLAATKNINLILFSPVSWMKLNNHYKITNPELPTTFYIFGMLLLWTLLFYLLVKKRANSTQENNEREAAKWKNVFLK